MCCLVFGDRTVAENWENRGSFDAMDMHVIA
jgi:hypothetical protein